MIFQFQQIAIGIEHMDEHSLDVKSFCNAPDNFIEDDVHIGAHATIQRGALGETVIRRGARIGPHANIGHNVEIGEDVLVAGHAQIGGGARIGNGAIVWQGATVANGVWVGAGAVVGMSAAVRHNVPAGQVWAGNPAQKIR